jgi:hypothetical protein
MSFFSPYSHEFLRIAACVPRIGVGDPAFNVMQTLDLVRSGDARKIALYRRLGSAVLSFTSKFIRKQRQSVAPLPWL